MAIDELDGRRGLPQPIHVLCHLMECEKRATHRESVGEIGSGDIEFVVAKAAVWQTAMLADPSRRIDRFIEVHFVAGGRIEVAERNNVPTILARIDVWFDSRHAP